MSKTKLAVFDIDGTILNTFNGIKCAINGMRQYFGLQPIKDSIIVSNIGKDIDSFIRSLVPEKIISNVEIIEWKRIRQECFDNNTSQIMPYDGIQELLLRLQNESIQIAVLTNKSYNVAVDNCREFFGNINFVVIKGDRSSFDRKPSPNELLDIINTTGVSLEETVFVGDSELDVMCASNAKVRCIAVLWGFRDKDTLISAGATCIVNNSSELYAQIVKDIE